MTIARSASRRRSHYQQWGQRRRPRPRCRDSDFQQIFCGFSMLFRCTCMIHKYRPRTLKACKTIALLELCDIFLKRHFFWLRALFWSNWFFRNWQFTWVLLLQRTFWAPESATWFRLRPFLCLVLSISSFWLVGCLEWLCTNVPALLMKRMSHECNIEKHEKYWKPTSLIRIVWL